MAIDCRDVPANVTYDCANPWGQGCTSDKRFDFSSLWKYTQSIQQACANDSRLFQFHGGSTSPRNASLTQASCAAIAGSDWKYYPGADIWARLTTWKFPLLQLVASFPRPPLSFRVECFVIVHLLGDPIDTVQNLLAKMSSCQNIAKEWMADSDNLMGQPVGEDEDQNWKALALITDAYGEWNESGNARRALRRGLCVCSKIYHSTTTDLGTDSIILNVRMSLHQQFVRQAAHLLRIDLRNSCPSSSPRLSSSGQSELPFLEQQLQLEQAPPVTPSSSMWKPIVSVSRHNTFGSFLPSS